MFNVLEMICSLQPKAGGDSLKYIMSIKEFFKNDTKCIYKKC